MRERVILIRNATKKGYIVAEEGDGLDLETRQGRRGTVQKGMIQTINTSDNKGVIVMENEIKPVLVGEIGEKDSNSGTQWKQQNRVYSGDAVSIANTSNFHPYYTESEFELSESMKKYINSHDDKYVVNDKNLVVNRDVACTKSTREGQTRADASDYISNDLQDEENVTGKDLTRLRIRKLTPTECFRLMGVKDEDSKRITSAKTQKYKQAGNSIVVEVLMGIFGELLGMTPEEYHGKIRQAVEETRQG